jgi:hypothetical protein
MGRATGRHDSGRDALPTESRLRRAALPNKASRFYLPGRRFNAGRASRDGWPSVPDMGPM